MSEKEGLPTDKSELVRKIRIYQDRVSRVVSRIPEYQEAVDLVGEGDDPEALDDLFSGVVRFERGTCTWEYQDVTSPDEFLEYPFTRTVTLQKVTPGGELLDSFVLTQCPELSRKNPSQKIVACYTSFEPYSSGEGENPPNKSQRVFELGEKLLFDLRTARSVTVFPH